MNAAIWKEITWRCSKQWAMLHVRHLLGRILTLEIPSKIVELGARMGLSAMLMRRILDEFGSSKQLHVNDAFKEDSRNRPRPV